MAEVYKSFGPDDIITGDIQTVSQPLWSENMNPWTSGYGGSAGIGFFTSSAQVSQSGNYLLQVYHRNPATDSNAQIQLAVAYGHKAGSGSVGDPNTVGQNINDTPSRAIYSQYRNMLLPPSDTSFTFGTATTYGSFALTANPDDIMVFNIARSRFRQKIDPGNWTLRLGTSATSYMTFTDNSGADENPSVNQAGRVFNIISGSGGTAFTGTNSSLVWGLFYPDAGILVFDANKLKYPLGMPITSSSQIQAQNPKFGYNYLSAASQFSARSEEKVSSTHYFVRITNKQFNFTNNPTFVSGSNGIFKYSSMLRNPSVYVTTIGLYNNNNSLMAVAKLSKPLLKSFNREALIKVKLDY
jgi:hypothetical protein